MYSSRLLLDRVKRSFLPTVKLSISEWASENITISSGNNRGMKFDPEFMAYQKEILDTAIDPTIDKLVVVAAARIGKTFCVQNIMAYFMAHDPCSILYLRPSDDDIKKFSKEELTALIENTPKLRSLIDSSAETYDFKQYPGKEKYAEKGG